MNLPELIAAFAFFGAVVICPLVYLIMRHQRSIAEFMHKPPAEDLRYRVEALESEVRALQAERHDRMIRGDDERTGSVRLSN